jgi:hypothetical protein
MKGNRLKMPETLLLDVLLNVATSSGQRYPAFQLLFAF